MFARRLQRHLRFALRIVARQIGRLPGHFGGRRGVAMQLLWCSKRLLSFYAIYCYVVARVLLWHSEWVLSKTLTLNADKQ